MYRGLFCVVESVIVIELDWSLLTKKTALAREPSATVGGTPCCS